MPLDVEQVRNLLQSNRNRAGELQSLLAILTRLKLEGASHVDSSSGLPELESRIREVANWKAAPLGDGVPDPANQSCTSITKESFLNFMGEIPFAANPALAAMMDQLEKRGVVWITKLSAPPKFTGLDKLAVGQRVLALGSLEGNLEWTLARSGATVLGVEGSIENYNKCLLLKSLFPELKLEFINADVQQMEVAPEFDIIVCPGVLYHLHQPQKLLLKMRDLNPRYVYISTQVAVDASHSAFGFHVLGGLAELDTATGTYRGRWWSDVQKDNRNYHRGLDGQPSFWFYPEDLRRFVEDLGFKVVSWNIFDRGNLGSVALMMLSLPREEN